MFAADLTLTQEELVRIFTEVSRLKALYAISQTRNNQGFYEWFCRTLTSVLNTSASLLLLAVDDRVYFEHQCGVALSPLSDRSDRTQCAFVAGHTTPLIMINTKTPRTVRAKTMARNGIGAYLGVPIVLCDGMPLGVLCSYAVSARAWSETDLALVRELVEIITVEFEQRASVFIDRSRKPALNDLRRRIELGVSPLDIRLPKADFLAALRDARSQYGF